VAHDVDAGGATVNWLEVVMTVEAATEREAIA
jgi:hypothetical protein